MTNVFIWYLASDSLGYFFEPDFPALFKKYTHIEKKTKNTKAYIPHEAHAVIKKGQKCLYVNAVVYASSSSSSPSAGGASSMLASPLAVVSPSSSCFSA